MIKLVVNFNSSASKTYSFDSPSILIGRENSILADLKLPEDLGDKHVQILTQSLNNKPQYVIVNLANDPFVTLNGLSFGKRTLKDNDLIQIRNIPIRFEMESSESETPGETKNSEDIEQKPAPTTLREFTSGDIDALMLEVETLAANTTSEKPKNENGNNPPVNPVEVTPIEGPLSSSDSLKSPEHSTANEEVFNAPPLTQDTDLENLFEALNERAAEPISPSFSNITLGDEAVQKMSLKDFYLSEYDEESAFQTFKEKAETPSAPPKERKHWSQHLKLTVFFLLFASLTTILTYLWIGNQSKEAEKIAAGGIADVAMALTYSHVKHIHPQNQNWSDPEFINSTLTSILAPNYVSLADFDKHGQFSSIPYVVRIYSSTNLSQFLVIAQPSPSLSQWLTPKDTLVIDSHNMEIRKIDDLQALNRLLVAADAQEINQDEISALINQGELLPLESLNSAEENYGFAPPKILSSFSPGAENYIYNAPRYYLLGQNLINTARELVEKPANNHEVALFKQEVDLLTDFPKLVLYSFDGLNSALESQKALALLAPKEKFLMAYLQLDNQGQISHTSLLIDEDPAHIAEKAKIDDSASPFPKIPENFLNFSNIPVSAHEDTTIDPTDPLYARLSNLEKRRQLSLKPVVSQLFELLVNNMKSPQPNFSSEFSKLQAELTTINDDQHHFILQEIGSLARESKHLPTSHFIDYIHATNLELFLNDYLASLKQNPKSKPITQEEIETLLKHIEMSLSWHELEHYTSEIAQLLSFDHIPDPASLIAFQNAARTYVIQKLNLFLLSSKNSDKPQESFLPEHRNILSHILELAWILDPATSNFYLSEFELRTDKDSPQ